MRVLHKTRKITVQCEGLLDQAIKSPKKDSHLDRGVDRKGAQKRESGLCMGQTKETASQV